MITSIDRLGHARHRACTHFNRTISINIGTMQSTHVHAAQGRACHTATWMAYPPESASRTQASRGSPSRSARACSASPEFRHANSRLAAVLRSPQMGPYQQRSSLLMRCRWVTVLQLAPSLQFRHTDRRVSCTSRQAPFQVAASRTQSHTAHSDDI